MPRIPKTANGSRSGGKSRSRSASQRKPAKGANGDAPGGNGQTTATIELNDFERGLLGDLFAVVEEHAGDASAHIDRDQVERAFVFSCERHADQRRQSGEDFIVHPVGVAKICAEMRLDTATLCAALL